MSRKRYLGDSVYVEIERDMLKLTTENGNGPVDTIYLEMDVFDNLRTYVERLTEELQAQADATGEP